MGKWGIMGRNNDQQEAIEGNNRDKGEAGKRSNGYNGMEIDNVQYIQENTGFLEHYAHQQSLSVFQYCVAV